MDKGYTEVLTDSDGSHHGQNLGRLSTEQSDRLKERNRRRAKLRSVANQAAQRGDRSKTDRITRNNLGTVTRDRQAARWQAQVRTETFTAVHAVVDKAATVVAEDLTRAFAARKRLSKNMSRRLAAWTKGVTAEALQNVSERRGSALVHVNAAYTSQACHRCGTFGNRAGDRLHCTPCGVVWQADVNAAVNILQDRTRRHRARLPIQDSSRDVDGGERTIHRRSGPNRSEQ